jgi:hypothetical protein
VAALAGLVLLAAVPARADPQQPPPAAPEGSGVGEMMEPVSPWEEMGVKAVDAAVVRPLGAVATLVGAAFFVISVPLVAASGGIRESWDLFVMGPVDYTFVRPLGEL